MVTILGSWEVLEKFIYWEEGKLLLSLFAPWIYFDLPMQQIFTSLGHRKDWGWDPDLLWWAPGPTGKEAG